MAVNSEPAREVAQRLCACDIRADDVTLDDVAGAVLPEGHTRVAIVARDQIARRSAGSGCEAAYKCVRDATIETQANVWTTQSDGSGYIRANEVTLDCMIRSPNKVNAAVVRGYDVTCINGCATDEGTCTAGRHSHPRVLQSQGATYISTDKVTLNHVSIAVPQTNADPGVS